MNSHVAETLMITSRCSAGCLPCPFGNGSLEQRYLDVDRVVAKIRATNSSLIVISGGEPLEHPQFMQLAERLHQGAALGKPFRIATGGHQPLAPYLDLISATEGFRGFSLGTDVLSSICPGPQKHAAVWQENVKLLNERKLPYSITLTVHADMINPESVLREAQKLGARPEFTYLRILSQRDKLVGLCRMIRTLWPKTPLIFDDLVGYGFQTIHRG